MQKNQDIAELQEQFYDQVEGIDTKINQQSDAMEEKKF